MWFLGNWFHWGWFGGLGFLGFVAVVTLVIVLAVRSGNRGREVRTSRPEEILKERLAKGEIDQQTYEELLKKVRQ